jgi:UDP-N-acetylmuramate--alanine ligase
MKLDDVKYAYFLGIGGIGMSAIARWFAHNGVQVSGYDRTSTPLTRQLEDEGIAVHYQDLIELIAPEVITHKAQSLIIYTPAIPTKHQQWNWLIEQGYVIKKRSEVLGMITQGMFTVAIAGTHGKTTTTSMVAHILKHSNRDCTAFMGGISANYNTNLLINTGDRSTAIAVVEADEYDRSFLRLHPNISVITSTDPDHLDIYGDHQHMKEGFRQFAGLLASEGVLFAQERTVGELSSDDLSAKLVSYGINEGQHAAVNLRVEGSSFMFDAQLRSTTIYNINLQVPGYHNVENAMAAISVADHLGVTAEQIQSAIASYKGVKRRFEYLVKTDQLVYIDDYAHHPEEISALLRSVRALYPGKKITAVFQPHLFSRTRDFAAGFSQSLSLADEVLLLQIYPARELPMEGVNSAMLLEHITAPSKCLLEDDELLGFLANHQVEVLVTVGAGDIDRFVQPIADLMERRVHVA